MRVKKCVCVFTIFESLLSCVFFFYFIWLTVERVVLFKLFSFQVKKLKKNAEWESCTAGSEIASSQWPRPVPVPESERCTHATRHKHAPLTSPEAERCRVASLRIPLTRSISPLRNTPACVSWDINKVRCPQDTVPPPVRGDTVNKVRGMD